MMIIIFSFWGGNFALKGGRPHSEWAAGRPGDGDGDEGRARTKGGRSSATKRARGHRRPTGVLVGANDTLAIVVL